MTFGERLRQLRRERQMNQRTLAARVGIDFTYLSKIENGRMDPPSADTIVKLAEALDADADALLLLAGKVPKDIALIVTQSPGLPAFLRAISDLREDELRQLRLYAQELREKRGPRKLTRRAR
jgi:HTH-type transcriptional regulator, competence development regulator